MTYDEPILCGIDLGASSLKITSAHGETITPARVGLLQSPQPAAKSPKDQPFSAFSGYTTQYFEVAIGKSTFCVGEDAYECAFPLENVSTDRFGDYPTMRAILYVALFAHLRECKIVQDKNKKFNLLCAIGLPLSAWGDNLKTIIHWLEGTHTVKIRGAHEPYEQITFHIHRPLAFPQAVGALYDWAIQDDAIRQEFYDSTIGVINIGLSTTEIMISDRGKPIARASISLEFGVKHYIQMYGLPGYAFGEIDRQIRTKAFEHRPEVRLAWEARLTGLIEPHWAQLKHRITHYIITGGGAYLLLQDNRSDLNPQMRKFLDTADKFVCVNDVQSTARGLFKLLKISQEGG
jgi:hypothetical protein